MVVLLSAGLERRSIENPRKIPKQVQSLRDKTFQMSGVIVPDVQFEVEHEREDISFAICFHGVEVERVVQEATSEQCLTDICAKRIGVFLQKNQMNCHTPQASNGPQFLQCFSVDSSVDCGK